MVKVGFLEDDPIVIAAVAVKISQTPLEKGNIQDLYEEARVNRENSKKLVNRVISFQHLIFGDFLNYAITLEDLTRFAAIYFWRNVNTHNLVFGAGIEASFRVIRPNRYHEVLGDFGKIAFELYQKAIDLGVPEQDARYLLPEGTLTRMVFSSPARYLLKLARSLKTTPLEELVEIGKKIEGLIKERFGFEMPEEKLPSEWKFWGKEEIESGILLEGNKKIYSISLNMGLEGSLAMYAQLVRQRQILCQIESLESIVEKARFVVPPTFPDLIRKDYQEIAKIAHRKQLELLKKKDPNFVYFLLLGQEAGAMIYGKGAGLIEMAKSRSEGVAQWEIRNRIGIPVTRELARDKKIRKMIGPRCWREGRCIEPPTFKTKKSICKAFQQLGGKWEKNLDELLEILEEPYEIFEL
jgi:thymidylate synthase ThyX